MFDSEFEKIPHEPPRRVASLPGLKIRSAMPKSMLVLPLLFLALFLLMPLVLMSTDPAMRLAIGPAAAAQGHVTKVSTGSMCRGSPAHRVQYVFTSSGRDYKGAVLYCEDSPYYGMAEGDTVEVRYLQHDPATSTLRNGRADNVPPLALFLVMPCFLLLMIATIYWPSVREVLRAKRLFAKGRISHGEVLFIKKRTAPYWAGASSAGAAEVFIRIPTTASGPREVVATCRNDWLTNQLSVGSTVHIAHWDDTSREVALLDAYLR